MGAQEGGIGSKISSNVFSPELRLNAVFLLLFSLPSSLLYTPNK